MTEICVMEGLLNKIDDIVRAFERAGSATECFALLRECHLALEECVRVGRSNAADVAVQEKVISARSRLIKLGNDIAIKLKERSF